MVVNWWAKRVHTAWQIAAASAGLIIGVALVVAAPFLVTGWEWLIAGLAIFTLAAIKQTRWALAAALIGGLLVGFVWGSIKHLSLEKYQSYYGHQLQISGKIAEDPTTNDNSEQSLVIKDVKISQNVMAGTVWVSAKSMLDLKRGDSVLINGQLSEGFGNVPATMFRAEIIHSERPMPGDMARRLRDWFADGVRAAISEPQASLGIGYLVGQRSALPESLESEFRMLGLSHLVVASGANLVIIARLLRRAIMPVSKFAATAATFGFIGGFLMLTGFSTSMVRAAIVASLGLLAWYYGRNIHPVVLILFGAAITLIIDPSFLWGDVGWYLSFAAFIGVVMLAPLINSYFWGNKEPGAFRYILVATVAAQIVTFPIIAFAFGQYSPLALVANLLIQPFVPLAMLLTFFAGIAGLSLPPLAMVVGWPAEQILSYMTNVTSSMSGSPLASGELDVNILVLILMYASVIGLMIYLQRRTKHCFRQDSIVE